MSCAREIVAPVGRLPRLRASLLVLVATVVVGCGGDAGGVATLDDFINQAARSYCSWQFGCCAFQTQSAAYATVEGCVPYVQLELRQRLAADGASVASGRATFDSANAAACLAALDARSCNAALVNNIGGFSIQPGPGLGACRRLLVGKVPIGSDCRGQGECVPGARCAGALAVGPSSSDDLSSLLQGTADEVGACISYQELGGICNVNEDCDPAQSLYCRGTDFRCQPLGQAGDDCFDPNGSGPLPGPPIAGFQACDTTASLFCDPNALVCRHLPGDGEPCFFTASSGTGCDPDPALQLSCVGAQFNGTGICKKAAQLGDVCGGSGIPPCAQGLACPVDQTGLGHCTTLPDLGESCDLYGHCRMPFGCNPGTFTCEMPGSLVQGATCTANTDCASLVCSSVSDTRSACAPFMGGNSCSTIIKPPTGFGGIGGGFSTGGGGSVGGGGGAAGSTGSAGAAGGASGGTTMVPPINCAADVGITPDTISDFEDGTAAVLTSEGRSGAWSAFGDAGGCGFNPEPGQTVTPTLIPGGRCKSSFALALSGSACPAPGVSWGADFAMAPPAGGGMAVSSPYDASSFSGVSFWIRADAPAPVTFRVSFDDVTTAATGDSFGQIFFVPQGWTFFVLRFADLTPMMPPATGPQVFDPTQVVGIRFELLPVGQPYTVWIDDVSFVR